jgi:hypothetical protein
MRSSLFVFLAVLLLVAASGGLGGGSGAVAFTLPFGEEAPTGSSTYEPSADARVEAAHPDANFGADAVLGADGAEDLAGNGLAVAKTWSFTTTSTLPTTTLTFGAEADARVEANNAGRNYGTQDRLIVDSSPATESYLRFSVNGIGGPVQNAKLRVYAYNGTNNGPKLYAVADNSWTETGITWNNKPAKASAATADKVGPVNSYEWVELDVTSLVSDDGTFSFNLTADSGDGADFRSREYTTTTSLRPQLVVTYEGNPPPNTDPPTVSASPPGGSYSSTQSVTLTASEPSTNWYTSDGSDPTTSGTRTQYSGEISIAATTTLKFYAVTADNRTSEVDTEVGTEVGTEVYTIITSTGYRGPNFTGTSDPTAKDSESKLWFNDGFWWGALFNSTTCKFQIFKLDPATPGTWTDTGVVLETRSKAKLDVLWDGGKLYVVSHTTPPTTVSGRATATTNGHAELRRYSYNASTDTYTRDFGPVTVAPGDMEVLVLARDTTGTLWVAFTQDYKVKINRSLGNDAEWGTPSILPVQGLSGNSTSVSYDDTASIVAFGGKVGVMWGNQCPLGSTGCPANETHQKMYFAWHADGTAATAWTGEVAYAVAGKKAADDHINLKADSAGRVYAAVKTEFGGTTDPLINLQVRQAAGGWSSHTAWTVGDGDPTRGIVVIDEQNGVVYMFAAGPCCSGGKIYYKQSSLANISFKTGKGTVFIESSTDTVINNPTSTKQTVNSSTGVVVLAGNYATTRYLHNLIKWE